MNEINVWIQRSNELLQVGEQKRVDRSIISTKRGAEQISSEPSVRVVSKNANVCFDTNLHTVRLERKLAIQHEFKHPNTLKLFK